MVYTINASTVFACGSTERIAIRPASAKTERVETCLCLLRCQSVTGNRPVTAAAALPSGFPGFPFQASRLQPNFHDLPSELSMIGSWLTEMFHVIIRRAVMHFNSSPSNAHLSSSPSFLIPCIYI